MTGLRQPEITELDLRRVAIFGMVSNVSAHWRLDTGFNIALPIFAEINIGKKTVIPMRDTVEAGGSTVTIVYGCEHAHSKQLEAEPLREWRREGYNSGKIPKKLYPSPPNTRLLHVVTLNQTEISPSVEVIPSVSTTSPTFPFDIRTHSQRFNICSGLIFVSATARSAILLQTTSINIYSGFALT
jgi:hypothetical protein